MPLRADWPTPGPAAASPHRPATIALRGITSAAVLLVALGLCMALWFQRPLPPAGTGLLMACCVAAALAATLALWRTPTLFSRRRPRQAALVAYLWIVACGLFWWLSLQPSHQRVWADDVAQLLSSSLSDDGHTVMLTNVRNFRWRTTEDYDIRWETRRYDLSQLTSADLILSYWMGPHIAHTLVSFGFADGEQLVFSAEIRKERGEAFSTLGGFFKQFELVVIAATEEDIVRTRTNARGEDVYLYRLHVPQAALRPLFLQFLASARAIEARPQFYNTLTSNCTTIVFDLARQLDPDLPLDWRLLLSGHLAGYAHDLGALAPGYDAESLRQAGRITPRALATDNPASPLAALPFSRAIRVGVPGMPDAPTAPASTPAP